MDDGAFRRVAGALRQFHKRFASLFGRKEARLHGAQYVRGLLTTREERRNAENLAEVVAGTGLKDARALQAFLTESPWSHEAVLTELQRFLADQLLPQEAGEGVVTDGVFTLDGTGFAKRGKQSAGVARQYSGTLGKGDNCQIGIFLGYATARGHALIDGQLWLPREWSDPTVAPEGPARCRRARVPEVVLQAGYQSQADVGLALLRRARAVGALIGRWVTADEAFGQLPTFRDALAADGWWYVAEVPITTPVFAAPPTTQQVSLVPGGAARATQVWPAAHPVRDVASALPAAQWTTVTVTDGAQGPRVHRFAALRGWESRNGVPGRECWLVLRCNLDGSEPKYSLSNAPEHIPLAELARVGATRWTVETEFQTNKGLVGLDEYEVRSWPGWHHHMTLCLLANAFLLSLQRDWTGAGEKAGGGRSRRAPVARPAARHAARPAARPAAGATGHARPSRPHPTRAPAATALALRRSALLAHRNPPPQRLRQGIPRQAPATAAH